jgi:hypothetical protein
LLIGGQQGLLAPKPKRIPLCSVCEIGIGHYDSDGSESIVTLNVNYFNPRKRKVRRMIGYWLHPTLKEKVFSDMQEFASRNQLSISFERY